MTLQLEKKNKTAVLSFGRHNPPTTGHEKLLNKVHSVAKQHGGTAHVVTSHSHDAHKNPVPQDKKLGYLRKVAHPDVKVSGSSKEHPTILHHASKLHAAGHKHLVVVAGADREKEFHKTLNTYNGKEGKHGHYNFKSIKVVSSGKRDPDAHGTEGISGTKMRDHARAGRHKEFKQGLPKALHPHAKEIHGHTVGGTQLESFKEALDRMRNKFDKKKKFKPTGEKTEVIMHVNPPAPASNVKNGKPGSPAGNARAGGTRFGESRAGNVLAGTKRGSVLGFSMGEDVNESFENIEEVLSRAGRIKRGLMMRRIKHKVQRKKAMMRKKMATVDMLSRRSRRHAVRLVRKRFMGKKGENYAKLGMSDKIMIDKRMESKKAIIVKIAQRLLPKVRRAELIRLKNYKQNKIGSASKASSALSINKVKQSSSEDFVMTKKDVNAIMEKAMKHNFDANVLFELFAMGAEQEGKGTPQQRGFQSLNTFLADIKKDEVNETMKDWQGQAIQGTQLDRRFNSVVVRQSAIPKLQEFKADGERSDIEDPIDPKTVAHDIIDKDSKLKKKLSKKKIKRLSELEYPHETAKKYKKDTPGQNNESVRVANISAEVKPDAQVKKDQEDRIQGVVKNVRKDQYNLNRRIKRATNKVLNPKTKTGGVQNEDAAAMMRVKQAQTNQKDRLRQQHEREMEQMDNSDEKKKKREAFQKSMQTLKDRQMARQDTARARLPR